MNIIKWVGLQLERSDSILDKAVKVIDVNLNSAVNLSKVGESATQGYLEESERTRINAQALLEQS